jgi:small subunit ribosomal protein S6
MPFYETVFIARQDLSPAQVDDLTKLFTGFITKDGGKILKTESWGLRQLAYRINKNRKGHYVLIESDSPPPAVIEMERNIRLHEDVLRYMTIRLDEPSKGQSAILGGSDRSNDSETPSSEERTAA